MRQREQLRSAPPSTKQCRSREPVPRRCSNRRLGRDRWRPAVRCSNTGSRRYDDLSESRIRDRRLPVEPYVSFNHVTRFTVQPSSRTGRAPLPSGQDAAAISPDPLPISTSSVAAARSHPFGWSSLDRVMGAQGSTSGATTGLQLFRRLSIVGAVGDLGDPLAVVAEIGSVREFAGFVFLVVAVVRAVGALVDCLRVVAIVGAVCLL